MNGPRGKSPARAGIGRRGRALRSGDGGAVVGRHLRLRCVAEADNSRSSSLARMCAKTLVCGEKCSPKSSPPMSTGICKSLKKGPKGPFFVPAKATGIHPQPELSSPFSSTGFRGRALSGFLLEERGRRDKHRVLTLFQEPGHGTQRHRRPASPGYRQGLHPS